MSSLMPRLDRVTRAFWRTTGRPVDLGGSEQWLATPMHDGPTIGDGWITAAAAAYGGTVREGETNGLPADMAELDGPGFRAADLLPQVRDFYEHTARWRMEVWTEWNTLFQPGGELISRYFGRRVQQLALPARPLDVALGMNSRVVSIVDNEGQQQPPVGCARCAPPANTSTAAATPAELCRGPFSQVCMWPSR